MTIQKPIVIVVASKKNLKTHFVFIRNEKITNYEFEIARII